MVGDKVDEVTGDSVVEKRFHSCLSCSHMVFSLTLRGRNTSTFAINQQQEVTETQWKPEAAGFTMPRPSEGEQVEDVLTHDLLSV